MQIFRFGEESGKRIRHFDSNFVMSRIVMTEKPAHIGSMHLASNGVIGFHKAASPQLLLIVSGQGWVRCGSSGAVPVAVGDAVFWEAGEWHETTTDSGLSAIVIESEALNPKRFMPSRE
ncbi:cupin domain-containing protein [Sulfobacillus harzensis]|uniref:Cupin n=1 Tax=Sulfobacillus harzensis TaxID=2729629 RepID=A0A7Y0Q478_9FIRM|nr:cupin [Sulfobacillus harzensis]NMP23716.1 cupin [Sulfobacillus harzensis]